MMRGASYVPGEWCLVVADGGFAALQADVPADLVARIWERLGRDHGLSPVLEALTGAFGTSLAAIPPFAVALTEGDALRVAVRGDIAIEVTTTTTSETVTGAGVTTWSERVIAGARTIDVTLPGGQSTDDAYPIADGVVFASRLRVEVTAAASAPGTPVAEPVEASSPTPTAAPVAEPVEASSPTPPASPGAPVAEPVEASSPTPIPPLPTPPLIDRAPAAPAPTPAASAPATAPLIDSADVHAAADGETLLPVESTLGPESAVVSEYDHLWGATIARPIEDAAVRPDEGEPALHTEGPPAKPAPAAPAGDHDGATISVAQARALRAATTDPPESPPPVTALLKAGPSVGRIRLSTGDVVELDRTVVIGRRPRATRVSGTHLPHLIAVDSPQQDISRSHVEIRPEGDSVIVVDLHTTNGTTLLRAGKEPVRLHPGEQTVVVTGDVIDLGDGITVAFEDLP